MLVLTRCKGERIFISTKTGLAIIKVLRSTSGELAQFSIEAPEGMPIKKTTNSPGIEKVPKSAYVKKVPKITYVRKGPKSNTFNRD